MAVLPRDDVEIRPLTRSDVLRMVEAGILAEDDRVELLDGVLVQMSPISPEHMNIVNWLTEHFVKPGSAWVVSIQNGLAIAGDERQLPQPDVALLPRERDVTQLSERALLVVEVAVTSHRVDRQDKAPKYALTGVPEYWVVDVPGGTIEVRRRPVAGDYTELRVYGAGETVHPLAPVGRPVGVDALFAALG